LPRPARADEEAGTADKVSNQSSGKISGAVAIYNRFEYLDERKAALEAPGRYIVYRAPLCTSVSSTWDCNEAHVAGDFEAASNNERRRLERNRTFVDSPLEEAVWSEPVSETRKFPASWENTGKFIDFGL